MDKPREDEREERHSRLEEHFKNTLSPMEPTIMRIQSLLVWESPYKSVVMIGCIHGVFWFLTYGNCRLYSTLSTALMILYFLHTWKRKIWPEIRVPPKSPDADDWTPVHPRLLSVPELCRHLAGLWCYVTRCAEWWITLRRQRPFKFFIESSFIFTCGAIIGHYISGVMLSYIIIMSGVLWPCLQYHNLLKKIYMKFEPVFMKLDYSIKVKNKWRYKERATVTTNENTDDAGQRATSVCADNESDLEDFYPSTDPLISAALARAITDSEDEGGTPSANLSPGMSREPSVVNSDDEHKDDEMENDFALSIDMMPSFEDTLDHTDDESLMPSLPHDRASRESSEESMRFIPSHFDDSEEGDDFEPPQNEFPSLRQWSESSGRAGRERDAATRDLAGQLVSQAFSSVISSALQSSVMGALQNMAGATGSAQPRQVARDSPDARLVQDPGDRIASTHSDTDEDDMDNNELDSTDARVNREESDDSASADIEEDFEFLEEYEIELTPETKTL